MSKQQTQRDQYNLREAIDYLIHNRRAVFPVQMNGEKIPDEIVKQLLENANWAPTHHYTEPWRFKVFSGKSLEHLVSFQRELYQKETPPDQVKEKKVKRYEDIPNQVSHIIAICMKRAETGKVPPEVEELAAVACAVQNIWLSLLPHGLAGYWSTGNGTYSEEMKDFLDLGVNDRCMGFFFLGKTDQPLTRGRRKPIEEKVEWR